ncbi:MAG TPA: hypothetical protein VFT57_16995 [Gemmatimonadaceae bacterium]|nr:hypothetical protein [Gemmatimonadaceae bacterium]
MPVMGPMGAFLLQSAASAAAARQATANGGLVEVVAIIAIAVIGLVLIALLAVLIPAVLGLRKTAAKMETLMDRVSGELDPILGHAKRVADNAEHISTVVRADVGEVSGTLRRANDRLNLALDATERRVRELGALLRLFQDEVEHTFVSGSSMLRGFRAGADSLRYDAMDLLDELDELEDEDDEDLVEDFDDLPEGVAIVDAQEIDDDIEDTLEDREETDDGYEWARDGGDGRDGPAARPRIRHRPDE